MWYSRLCPRLSRFSSSVPSLSDSTPAVGVVVVGGRDVGVVRWLLYGVLSPRRDDDVQILVSMLSCPRRFAHASLKCPPAVVVLEEDVPGRQRQEVGPRVSVEGPGVNGEGPRKSGEGPRVSAEDPGVNAEGPGVSAEGPRGNGVVSTGSGVVSRVKGEVPRVNDVVSKVRGVVARVRGVASRVSGVQGPTGDWM